MKTTYVVYLSCAALFTGISSAVCPLISQAQTITVEDRDTHPIGSERSGRLASEEERDRARVTEAERRRVEDERRSYRDRPSEAYVAGFGGVTLGHSFSDIETSGARAGEDISLKNSVVYGGKIGYFLPGRLNWLGFEVEGFNTTPHFEQEGSVPGSNLRVTTAAFNVVARLQLACDDVRTDRSRTDRTDTARAEGRSPSTFPDRDHYGLCHLQPYIGAGPGVFFAHISNGRNSSSDNGVVGFNGLAGVRYFFTDTVALFAEYKYNRASFEFDNGRGGAGISGDYSVSHVVGGLSLHF